MHLSWIITFSRNLASSSIFFNKIYQEITELKAQVNRLKEDAKKARDGRKILNLPTRIGSNDQEEIVRYIVRFLKDWQLIMNQVHFDLNFLECYTNLYQNICFVFKSCLPDSSYVITGICKIS